MLLFGLAALCFLSVTAQKKQVTGTVRDADGNGVPSVTVKEKGTNNQTLTNASGTFKISVASNATLVFSSVGYVTQEMSVDGKSTIEVSLASSSKEISEVVVTSLGITKQQKSLGYAATTIKAAELTQTASTNFATALYGKAPGVRIAAAPGGSTSGVAIQIRGINSITGRNQPLIIMDGVPIRDGNFNNTDYWSDQRVRANGLVDLNPEDIETITVLKGASAAALYGSEATNGVLVITTKSGKGKKGFNVDAKFDYFQERVAYLPKLQSVRGAGSPIQYDVYGQDANGFNSTLFTINSTQYRALVQGSLNFGPVFDGQPIACWDGQVRPYSAQKNGYANLFQVGNNSSQNVAFTNAAENSSTRFSFTHNHYEGISLNSKNDKVTVSLNSTYNFGKKIKMNLVVNDVWQRIHNRPYMIDRLINNFTGMMPTFDNGEWYQNSYKTSLGYRYVTGKSTQSLTPNENIYIPNYRGDILDYMWRVKEYNSNENVNRLIASVTTTYDIVKNLQLRGRVATDYTSGKIEDKQTSTQPLVYGPSGYYGISTNGYTVMYGDLLLTYSKELNKDVTLKAMAGYTAQKDAGFSSSVGTNGGLVYENRFDITSSANTYSSNTKKTYLVKDAVLGTVNVDYKGLLYVEGTVRRDRTSTMSPSNNSFVYPSVNSAFVISEAFKLPEFVSYAKLRGSWGIVGNYPLPYVANVLYSPSNLGNQGSGTSTLFTTIPTSGFGNDFLKPETKHEIEFGLETRYLKDRVSLDVSYYRARIVDMILNLSLAPTTGSSSIWANVGALRNSGVEIALSGYPVKMKNFSWESGVNFSFNKNIIEKLTTGSNELIHANYDGDAAVLKSVVGRPIGDFYAHPIQTDNKGNRIVLDYSNSDFGKGGEIIEKIDASKWVYCGNAQPKAVGGFYNTFRYKDVTLEMFSDFRLGGYVMPTGLFWMNSRGLTEESLNYMDAAHGGVSYYKDAQGRGIETTSATGPNGEKVYHDGIKIGGVFADGTPNNYVTSQFYYYNTAYNWGGPQYSQSQYFRYIVKNTYWKMREIALSYSLPASLTKKVGVKKLDVSVFGRNLFYFYRSIKNMDAEQLTSGLQWSQNLNNAASGYTTRSFGASIKVSL